MVTGTDKLNIHLSSVIALTGNISKILQIHLHGMPAVSGKISAKIFTLGSKFTCTCMATFQNILLYFLF
jgi:hypothetical protein